MSDDCGHSLNGFQGAVSRGCLCTFIQNYTENFDTSLSSDAESACSCSEAVSMVWELLPVLSERSRISTALSPSIAQPRLVPLPLWRSDWTCR